MEKRILINNFNLAVLAMFLFSSALDAYKKHEIWWEENLDKEVSLEVFQNWLGDVDSPSRLEMRRHVLRMGYESIVDIPCGLCIDYSGFKKDGISIDYLGIDITPKLVGIAQKKNINAIQGSIENIPKSDSSFDMAYARHILEHLDDYRLALFELIRVAKKEVFITFFIQPKEGENNIDLALCNHQYLYHNTYNKREIESCLESHEKVKRYEWQDLGKEVILHIYLND
jgi:ubiquinone/menaquinone biosynthesis C-methylase UbiE